jgi:hypothetical protein
VIDPSPVHDVPPIVHEVLRQPGQPLDPATRSTMELRFGHDFSGVRVHTDGAATESARTVKARAFTVGRNIVFDSGQYEPGTRRGQSLLAHELAHVVQQSGLSEASQLAVELRSSSLERQAGWAAGRVASGQLAGPVGRTMAPGIQRNGPTEAAQPQPSVSLGFLDSRITDSIAGSVMGRTQWRLLREALRGLVEGIQGQSDERKNRIIARFQELSRSLSDQWSYFRGYLVGIGLGLWDSLRGIVELLTLGPRMLWRAMDWLVTHGPGLVQNFDQIVAEAEVLRNHLAEIGEQARTTLRNFVRHPAESIEALRAMLDRLSAAAQERARRVGRDVAERIFQFLELPWQEFGQGIGHVVGMALFEALLAVATSGIGNALRAIGSALARGAQVVAAIALRVFRAVIEAVRGLSGLLRSLGRIALGVFEGLAGSLGRLLERVESLVRRVLGGMEAAAEAALPERALAGGGRVPPGTLMSEARGAGQVPTRTTMTTVEELAPPRTPRSVELGQGARGFVQRITQAGLDHSFDRHAAEWFGGVVTRDRHFPIWRSMIERVSRSRNTFPWNLTGRRTRAYLGRVPLESTQGPGRYFVVQFFEDTGELATAFRPNPEQLTVMFRLL